MTICFVALFYFIFLNTHLDFTNQSQLCRKAQTEIQAELRLSSKYIKAVKNIRQTKGRSITKWKLKASSIMSMQILKMVLLSCLSDPFEDVNSKEKTIWPKKPLSFFFCFFFLECIISAERDYTDLLSLRPHDNNAT